MFTEPLSGNVSGEHTEAQTHREQDDRISFLSFFNKKKGERAESAIQIRTYVYERVNICSAELRM
jgi:hypothetical protein